MNARRGLVLVVVMVIMMFAAMVVASLLFRMRSEVAASAGADTGQRAYEACMSGIQRAICLLKTSSQDMDLWYDNPALFQNQLVWDDGVNKWYFTIYADNPIDRDNVRFGPEDEAAKININTADADVLLSMPNMTAELVDCLIDYRDRDGDTRPQGAEQDYYAGLPQPYLIKNAPFTTLEELLLVKGFNGQIVYGEDVNMNGLLDQNEDDGDESFPLDNADGKLDTGLRGVATVLSYELPVDSSGKRLVFLNGDVSGLQGSGLPKQTIDFITAYLAEGNKFKHPSELLQMQYQLKNPPKGGGPSGSGTGGAGGGRRGGGGGTGPAGPNPSGLIESGVGAQELPAVLGKLTTSPGISAGLVNVNTASVQTLSIVLGLDEGLAQRIADARTQLEPSAKATTAWLFTQELVDAATFKRIAPRLTTRSSQFHIRCVGFGLPCAKFRVLEAIVDFAQGQPRIVYIRDITRLGLPFPLNLEEEQVRG